MFKRLLNFLTPYRPDLGFIKAREDAYERAFGVQAQILHSTDHKAPHIDLYVFPPDRQRDFVAVLTGGMSDLPMAVPDRSATEAHIELLMGIGQHQHWATNLLKLVAEYPFDQGTFYDVHHTVPFGGELGDGSSLSAFLFVRPRFLPEALTRFEFDGKRIGFLQAVPITTGEHQFAVAEGSDKLEALLEKHGYLITRDPNRQSVVKGAESGAAPNGGPATRVGNSGATEGPPSVS
jgi:hypothetical protein